MAIDVKYDVTHSGCWCCAKYYKARKWKHVNIKRNGKSTTAHIYSWDFHFPHMPRGDMVIRHKCDNPTCINPDHLELGTHAENVQDRVERNRSAVGKSNGRSKLNEENVTFIWYSPLPITELAEKFNVSRRAIKFIKNGRNWAWFTQKLPEIPQSL